MHVPTDALDPRPRHGATGTHLVFLPDPPRFFLWGLPSAVPSVAALLACGRPGTCTLVDESVRPAEVAGVEIPLLAALPVLARMAATEAGRASGSVTAWSHAAKLALELVGRERLVPVIRPGRDGTFEARWAVSLALPDDARRVQDLARAFPPAAHAVPAAEGTHSRNVPPVWAPDALLRAFLDAVADGLVRAAVGERTDSQHPREPWEKQLVRALTSPRASLALAGLHARTIPPALASWARPALGAEPGVPRACFRLDVPAPAGAEEEDGAPFELRYFLQASDDPSLLIPATEVWATRGRQLLHLGRAFHAPQDHLLRALGVAARLFPPIERSLAEPQPHGVTLDAREAWQFLTVGGPALGEAGFGVLVPAEFTRGGARRLRLRMRIGASPARATGAVAKSRGVSLDELVAFRWEAALGDETLSAEELAALAALKAPLVRWRGRWVAVDPQELAEVKRLLGRRGELPASQALAMGLGEAPRTPETALPVEVVPEGRFRQILDRLRTGAREDGWSPPRELRGTLRAYQARGVAWLSTMAEFGLGACLADDMGLGKTIQVLAFLLQRAERRAGDPRPSLVVCPTSVVGNWEREIQRFAPSLSVVRHYGASRAPSPDLLAERGARTVVLTTYGLLRRDAEVLSAVSWATVVLDEAQNIKNPGSRTARAARALRAAHRVALTGTPVENRLAELWSILEFATPGLLGSLEAFRRTYAVPIERYQDTEASDRLRRVVGPFILRRLKSDPAVIRDLPAKNEMRVVCTLTKEQATLYQAAVTDALRAIEESGGIQRRGRVLALITALKQICDHPALYLGERGPLPGRSGKLARLQEMLEEVVASGDRALVFTQFREMGERLVAHLGQVLQTDVLFLHGGTSRSARDAMVRRFQEGGRGPQVFVLSLRAGGIGLNLTAATHVFHFDRWWNPAVEDQATDRTYRIGQTRAVQVHKLVTAGTVEEKVDRMLEEKRDLASRIVAAGERWITELDDRALRDLFSLSGEAVVAPEEPDREAEEIEAPGRGGRRKP
jgi:hypothetical protein